MYPLEHYFIKIARVFQPFIIFFHSSNLLTAIVFLRFPLFIFKVKKTRIRIEEIDTSRKKR
jgi:hypothetical protein